MNNILIIDDEEIVRSYYQAVFCDDWSGLDVRNYNLNFASQGEEGINLIKNQNRENPYKVVFIDYLMPPGIDGMQTAKKIREIDPRIEIVMVSAYSDKELEEIGKSKKINEKLLYLKKPFATKEIIQFTVNLCEKYNDSLVKEEFIANISHELNTPLTAISGFHQLLEDLPGLSEEMKDYLGLQGQNIKVMKEVIKSLITVMEYHREGVQIKREKVNIIELVQNCYQSTKHLFDASKVSYSWKSPFPDDNCIVHCDYAKISQGLFHLIQNAHKFTKKGEVSLAVSVDEKNCYISIRDTGVGMAESRHKIIFEQFSRIENRHHNLSGIGLGLNIVKQIVDAHGGDVKVESFVGEGSVFTIVLPKK